MARNIVTKRKSEVIGLRELEAKLRDLKDAMVGREAALVVADAADEVEKEVTAGAMASGVPHEVLEDIYSYKRQRPDVRRKGVSALVGIRKRGRRKPWAHAYVEWGKRAHKLVGESLATMWEIGTSKMAARPFFRPAINRVRTRCIEVIAAGFKQILDRRTA